MTDTIATERARRKQLRILNERLTGRIYVAERTGNRRRLARLVRFKIAINRRFAEGAR